MPHQDEAARGPANMPDEANGTDPREQLQRSSMMYAAGKSMYEDKNLDSTLKMLSSGGSPIENVARGTAMLMYAMASSLEAQGKKPSEDALLSVGEEVLERMLALAVETGLIQLSSPQEFEAAVDQAGELALQTYESMRETGVQRAVQEQPPSTQEQQPAAQPQAPVVAGNMGQGGMV